MYNITVLGIPATPQNNTHQPSFSPRPPCQNNSHWDTRVHGYPRFLKYHTPYLSTCNSSGLHLQSWTAQDPRHPASYGGWVTPEWIPEKGSPRSIRKAVAALGLVMVLNSHHNTSTHTNQPYCNSLCVCLRGQYAFMFGTDVTEIDRSGLQCYLQKLYCL